VNGSCCREGFVDCDGLSFNGCETDLSTDPDSCGLCGSVCPSRDHAVRACVDGKCPLICEGSWRNCDGVRSTGCEINVMSNDVDNCGACHFACTEEPNAYPPTCVNGACASLNCTPGFINWVTIFFSLPDLRFISLYLALIDHTSCTRSLSKLMMFEGVEPNLQGQLNHEDTNYPTIH
jgi:hypothetical protein